MSVLKQIAKWGGLGLLLLLAVFFGYSQYLISSVPDRVPYTLDIKADAETLSEGERLAHTLGCFGCHAENLAGQIFIDSPLFARLVASNLTTVARDVSVEKLEAAIRQGIGFDGRALVVMPSEAFSYLTDEDTAAVIAYLRSLSEVENHLPTRFFGPLARFFFVKGDFSTEVRLIARKPALRFDAASEPELARGEYLAMTMCSECHGTDFNGVKRGGFVTPSLDIVAAYTPERFMHLLKTGEGVSGTDLGLMSDVARAKLVYLREEEMLALYAFLSDRITAAVVTSH